jgi:leader peptidase (prepilin peptidase)/N-methyltransferase
MLSNAIVFTVVGLLSGSLMNVVIWRLPLMLTQSSTLPEHYNLWRPRSHCCHCQHTLHAVDLIPLISWLLLKGRCRYCAEQISWRYPVIELVCALMATVCIWVYPQPYVAGAVYLFFWFALALSMIDFQTFLLPDKLTLPLMWCGLLINANFSFVPLREALYGAAAGYTILWLIFHFVWLMTHKEGLGYGDFKLLAAAGAWCGWQSLPAIVFFASVCGIIFALVRQGVTHKKNEAIAFGPWLSLGSWLYFCWLMWT